MLRLCGELVAWGVEGLTYMDNMTLGLTGVAASTVRTIPFLWPKLDGIGVGVSPLPKTVAPPP